MQLAISLLCSSGVGREVAVVGGGGGGGGEEVGIAVI